MSFFGFGAFSTPVGQLIGELLTLPPSLCLSLSHYILECILNFCHVQKSRQTTQPRLGTWPCTFRYAMLSMKLTMGECVHERERERDCHVTLYLFIGPKMLLWPFVRD